tara:strand:+ start:6832 stop:7191 length:360 start_codon:yes stop_codon:yes gene_type:complete
MAAFQNNVVRIATIVFIAFMALVSLMLLLAKENQQFPPMYPTCPDYYDLKSENGPKCEVKFPGMISASSSGGEPEMPCNKLDLTNEAYKGWETQQLKNKRKWAEACGVTWDGVTNVRIA